MKIVCTFCSWLISLTALTQSIPPAAGKKDSAAVIRFRCPATLNIGNKPLVLLDGVPVETDLSDINADDIESVEIFKIPEATALYGSRGSAGAILIVTRKLNSWKFIIRDIFNGERLAGATVMFKYKDHTVVTSANDSGVAVSDRVRSGEPCEIKVTMAGYATFDSTFSRQPGEQTILLKRDTKICPEVVVKSFPLITCSRTVFSVQNVTDCKIRTSNFKDDAYADKALNSFKIYPNPVRKGQLVTIELKNKPVNEAQVKIFSLDGRLLLTRDSKDFKNDNSFTVQADNRWTPGIYFIRVFDVAGKNFQTGKFVIQ